jgi:hypothetical protein
MSDSIVEGQMFTYRETSRFLRRQSGAGQVLGREPGYDILFVRIFKIAGEQLLPFIGFLPITGDAYQRSGIDVVKRLPLPDDWQSLRDEWRMKWQAGDAGAFSQPLRDVTRDALETVDHLRDGGLIELAFPRRSASGKFDTIEAFVRA